MYGTNFKLNLVTGKVDAKTNLVAEKAGSAFAVCHIGHILYVIGVTVVDKCFNILTEKWSDLDAKLPHKYIYNLGITVQQKRLIYTVGGKREEGDQTHPNNMEMIMRLDVSNTKKGWKCL